MLDVPAARALLEKNRPRSHAESYPRDVRAPVVELVQRRLAQGVNLNAIARKLGVNRGTLRYWLDHPVEPTAFLPVVLTPSTPPALEPTISPARSPLVLTSPAGFRLDGLELEQAIYAMQRLSQC